MQYYGYPRGVPWTPVCITLSSRTGLSGHWHGDLNRVLRELTSGTITHPHRYSWYSHRVLCVLAWSLQEGAIWSNRPSWQWGVKSVMFEVCCGVSVRQVCHSARHQTGRGDERLVYHPGNPTPHGIPPWCGIHHMVPSMGYSECPHGAHAWHIPHSRSALTGACACTRAHECALRAATISQRRITCAALSSFRLRIRRRREV
jgi:hypothetical protein